VTYYLPNGTFDRLRWIEERYRKRPVVTYETIIVALYATGHDRLAQGLERPDFVWDESALEGQWEIQTPGMAPPDRLNEQYVARFLEKLVATAPEIAEPSLVDAVLPWIAAQLGKRERALHRASHDYRHLVLPARRGEPSDAARRAVGQYWDKVDDAEEAWSNLSHALELRGPAIAQWADAEGVNLHGLDANAVLDVVANWRPEDTGEVAQGGIVFDYPDGWTVQQLGPDELEREGALMQHCVGDYCAKVEGGGAFIFSLRDPSGRPHVTMDYDPHTRTFQQVMGKQNQPPKREYAARARDFIRPYDDPRGLVLAGGEPGLDLTTADFSNVKLPPGLDLRGAELSHQDLSMIRLESADLTQANLVGADMRQANLIGASLAGANLAGANLWRADLDGADLSGADLTDAVLDGADLRGATLDGADVWDTSIEGATVDEHTSLAGVKRSGLHGDFVSAGAGITRLLELLDE
jgi:uncharacterized protein YjbI with pentapeptide repeats